MDWIQAHNELETLLGAITGIKHVDLYNEQPYYESEEYPYPVPAIFLDYSSNSIDSVGKLNQQIEMNVQVILQTETLADSHKGSANKANAINFATLLKSIHATLQGTQGSHYAEANRTSLGRLEAPRAYTQLWQQTYSISITDTAAMPIETLNDNAANTVAVEKE